MLHSGLVAGESSLERHYDWERYWVDRRASDGSIDGYFRNEDGGDWVEEGVNTWQLSELTGEPCLVLLGEPGLGKSSSLREAARILERQVDRGSEVVHLFNLAVDESPEQLTKRLMGGGHWDEWVNQGKVLHLFLDSLDEALINQRTLARLLVHELEAASEAIPRLRLRIACRAAEWPPGLSDELRRLFRPAYPEWPGALPRELVLAQLRKSDAGLAAEAEGLDRWPFLGSIADRDLEGMAALPLTLKMLLEAAQESGEMPDSREQLFEDTTRRLLLEHDTLRPAPSPGGLQPGQRLAVAERIAAVTLFSARPTIAKEPGVPGSAHLDPAQLTGFYEEDSSAAGGAAFEVGDAQIVEVLRTPIFVDAGRGAVRFRHRSLAEFLAASYLARHQLEEDRILSLFTTATRYWGKGLIPQLREVAVWTAALHPKVLLELLELDPEMLLRFGRLRLSAEQAGVVVEALLTERIGSSVNPWERRLWPSLRSLGFPGLADALRERLRDSEAPASVRSMAIAIAGACKLHESEADLLAVALDPHDEPELRALAIFGLGKFASQQTRRALVPLALEPIADDENDAIKAHALLATYPEQIDAATVFKGLTPPRSPLGSATYTYFLGTELPKAITVDELPTALRWAGEVVPNQDLGGPGDYFNFLADRILEVAWPHIADATIAAGVATVVARRLHATARVSFPGGHGEAAFVEAEGRRILIPLLIDAVVDDDDAAKETIAPEQLLSSSPPLLHYSDLGWLLDRFESSVGSKLEAGWAALIARVYSLQEPELERTFDLLARSEELRDRLGELIVSIDLGSELARRLRQAGCDREPEGSVPADAPYTEQVIAEALDRLEQGDPEAWLQLNDALMLGPRGEDAGCDPLEGDISRLPGWKRADHVTRGRIIAGALQYLAEAEPEAEEWFGQGELAPRALAGYRALYLVARVRFVPEPDEDVWAHWMPAILEYPVDADAGWSDNRVHYQLFRDASRRAPDAFALWVARKVDLDAARGDGRLSLLWRLRTIRPASLAAALMPKLAAETMQPRSVAELLEWALECDWVRSVEIVEPRLTDAAATRDAEARETAALAAAVIFRARAAAGWPLVRRLVKLDRELGSSILLHAAQTEIGPGKRVDLEGLPEAQLLELLEVLHDLFPPDGDPDYERGEDPPLRAHVASMRSSAEIELAGRGSEEAVAALADLAERHPDRFWSDHRLELAEEALRDRERAVMAPQRIVEICCANDPRLISSDADLQQAVIRSLERIQTSLQQGQPRTAPELWERSPRKPKVEEEVSNWLSNRLREDLRIGGREVYREVLSESNKTGKGIGESIDIQITAPVGKYVRGADNASIVVEVKGSWSKTLKTDMEKQLVGRYLRRSRSAHGIYIVLWFASQEWESGDWRRAPSGRIDLEELRELLAEQASELSSSGEVSVRSVVLDCSL
jgi:hypothetical protein